MPSSRTPQAIRDREQDVAQFPSPLWGGVAAKAAGVGV
jgi:hypothetical protein